MLLIQAVQRPLTRRAMFSTTASDPKFSRNEITVCSGRTRRLLPLPPRSRSRRPETKVSCSPLSTLLHTFGPKNRITICAAADRLSFRCSLNINFQFHLGWLRNLLSHANCFCARSMENVKSVYNYAGGSIYVSPGAGRCSGASARVPAAAKGNARR